MLVSGAQKAILVPKNNNSEDNDLECEFCQQQNKYFIYVCIAVNHTIKYVKHKVLTLCAIQRLFRITFEIP